MNGFVRISKYAGMREDLVQAGGGNSSYKIDDSRMVIKASGFQLAELTEETGYATVNYKKITEAFLDNSQLDQLTEEGSKKILSNALIEGKRPSIETFLHSISGKYTLHTHPITVNALTCRKDGMEVLEQLFPDALIVPYATPGVELAKTYFHTYKKKAKCKGQIFEYVFLLNHGLVVSAQTAEQVIDKTEYVVRKIEDYLGCDYNDYHRLTKLWNYFPSKIVWEVTDTHIITAFHLMGDVWNSSFCPDCVVFLGKKIMKLPSIFTEADIYLFECEYGNPVMILWQDRFYILADSVKKAMETQSVMSFSAQVMQLNIGNECNLLTDKEQNFLLNWDAEKYRANMK